MTLQVNPQHDREIAALGPWFHNVHLPDGRQTAPGHPLGDFPSFKWREVATALPSDLTGWTALDIGCNAGFYAFELAGRGADVVAIDADDHYLRQARWAHRQFDLPGDVDFRHAQVWDLAGEERTFDLVLFLGVLYHLRYPLLALDLVADRVGKLLVLQTMMMPGGDGNGVPRDLGIDERARLAAGSWPAMAFIEHSLAGDPTNWWAPNAACVEAMVRSSGLEVLERPAHEVFVCRPSIHRTATSDVQHVRSAFDAR